MLKRLAFAMVSLAVIGPVSAKPAPAPNYQIVERIAGPDGGWDLLSVDPVAHRLYVARTNGVMLVDLANGKVTPDLVTSKRGHDVLPIPGSNMVISSNGAANTVTLFNGHTGEVRATLPVGTKPDAMAWDAFTKSVWVMTPGSGDISVVDPVAQKIVATVPVGGSLELAASDGHGRLYVNIEDKNEVAVINTRTRKVVSRFPLKGCDGPTGIAYAADARLILSACANGVAIISAPNGHQVASLKVGTGPDGALYDAQRYLAFIPSGGDGTLSIIRLSPKPEVIATVPTAKGARTAALDPTTGRIYLPSAQYLPATGPGRPPMVPGSFQILVVAPAP
jgi:DNA-binding beta-propeller fold protein YncE